MSEFSGRAIDQEAQPQTVIEVINMTADEIFDPLRDYLVQPVSIPIGVRQEGRWGVI